MHLSNLAALLLTPLALALQTTLTLSIPAHASLPNPRTLPANTRATLSTLGASYEALLTPANTFVFRNVSTGSYLADVHCSSHAFAPLRVDVEYVEGQAGEKGTVLVRGWETFRGNGWENRGEAVRGAEGKLELRVLGAKNYFAERPKFNALAILKNPMILLGLVSMGLFIGMPYLMENMDPEMRAEIEEQQKSNPINSILSGATSGQSASSFDMAAYLAGSTKKDGKK